MKEYLLLISLLLLGCSNNESNEIDLTTDIENNQLQSNNETANAKLNTNIKYFISDNRFNNNNSDYLLKSNQFLQSQNYSSDKSLDKLIDSNDPRELVYLLHPTKNMLVYCYHASRSECHIEGVHNNEYFSYDISQVEGQNKGKLTAPGNPIESAKTFPLQWMTVNDEYAMVQMTSKIMMNSQQHTLHEPSVIYYKTGMMVR